MFKMSWAGPKKSYAAIKMSDFGNIHKIEEENNKIYKE